MGTDSKYFKEVINKLERLTKREYALFASIGLQSFLIISAAVFFSFTLLEYIGNFSSDFRTILFFVFLLFFFSTFIFLFVVPLLKHFNLFRKTDYFAAAGKVAKNFPSVKDDLLNAMQLVSGKDNSLYSTRMVDAAFSQVYNRTQKIEFEKSVSFSKSKQLLYYTVSIVVISFALIIFVPQLQAASGRILNFNQEFIPPAKFSFKVYPGNQQLTKGEDVEITAGVSGIAPREVYLAIKSDEQTDFVFYEMEIDSSGRYYYSQSSVRNSFGYYVTAEDVRSEEYKIEVIDRPIIKTFEVTITPPSYSRLPPVEQKDNGNITALIGSNVNLRLSSTKNLTNAEIMFGDSSVQKLVIDSEKATGNFRVRGDNSYQIALTDTNGNNNLFPITYNIKAMYDSYPSIDLISPSGSTDLNNDSRLPLLLKIADDYGFTKLLLHYRLSASKYEPAQEKFKSIEILFDKNEKESDINYVWNLSRMALGAQDVLTYYLEVFDNDVVSGPKSAKTSELTVRVPSLDEILAKADDSQNKMQDDLQETLKEAEELKKTLEKIDQDLKKDQKELTWEEKDKIEKALEKFEELQEKVESVSQELNDMKDELQENNLLSKETLEKYMELQDLMEQLTGEEMKKAMEQLQDMLKNMNRQQVQDAMQQMKMDEEKFQKSIERTLNLLKRVQIEQKVDEMLKRTENLTEKQEKLQQETSDKNLSDQNEQKDLSEKQNDISKDLERLEKEMKELADKMQSLEDMPNEEMEKLMEELSEQQNQEKSQEASKNIQQNQKQQAQQQQQQISKNMQKMNQDMQQMQESMMQQNQMQTFADMMRIMDNMITLSKQQEQLRKESQNLEPNSSSFNENADKQNNLQRNLDNILKQLSDLSQKTFAITPEMGKSLGDAKREMNKSIQAMQNRNGNMASNSQGEAMKSLNEAASLMKGSMESMMQGNGQGGMMSMMQQLGQMSQQQMGLNNMTQMLQQMQQNGQLSPGQQAEMQRLAQQQELIRKSIDQLNKEAKQTGKSKTLPGNLDNIVKEMSEVISDMNTQKLNDELVQKQERILSRMLDAQRSINERDFEKKRESNSGENIVRQSPAELNLSSEKGKDKIKDELNRAVQEGYTKDYENLIRKYYEALQKREINN
jgi:hypothetical protein